MKKLFIIIGCSSIILTSCKKFLDTKSNDIVSTVNYYSKESELNEALVGVYSTLAGARYYQDGWWDRLGGNNDESWNYTGGRFESYSYNSSDGTPRDAWSSSYQGIERANLLLANIEKVSMDATRKNYIKGQALFLRGFYHFMLVSNWGGNKQEGIPLKLSPTITSTDGQIPRTPTKEVYAQILNDMSTAQALLPSISHFGHSGRVSKTAAQGILARVCLNMAGFPLYDVSKYQAAKAWCDSVISSGEHSLNPDYPQIFINHSKDKYDIKECIWEAEFWGNLSNGTVYNQNSRLGSNTGPYCTNIDFGSATGLLRPQAKLYNLYTDSTDIRRDWNISPYFFKNIANPGFTTTGTPDPVIRLYWGRNQVWERFTGKWYREYEAISPKSSFSCPTNFPILRYSDVLLMYAEAENYLNGPTTDAIAKVNQVRQRALGTGSRISAITVTNQGSGYISAPAVTITGGGGNYVYADAILTAGKITGIRLVSGGAFFTSVPNVAIAGGGGTGATATATILSIDATSANLLPTQTASKDALILAIQDERAKELCYEALRKPDLIRWGIFITTMRALALDIRATAPSSAVSTGNTSSATFNYKTVAINGENVAASVKFNFFPIPTYDLSLNPLLVQNEGW